MDGAGHFDAIALERVVYGRPAHEVLPEELERLGTRRAFALVSESLRTQTDVIEKIETELGGRLAGVYSGMPPHTPREAVIEAARQAGEVNTDLIVTIGGGSLTDAGKLVQLCLEHQLDTVESLEPFVTRICADGKSVVPDIRAPQVRQLTVPTTLSGGEFGYGAGCTDSQLQVKQMFRHRLFVPKMVVLDPALTVHTPSWLWLSTGIRAVDHAVETLCSPFSTPHSDGPALHALRLLGQGLRASIDDPQNLEARLQCQLGVWASMEHNEDGVPMGASHGIGHVLGGSCGVPHGHTSCVMLPAVLRWNALANTSEIHQRQALVSEAMGRAGDDAADVIDDFVRGLGLPRTLGAVGVGSDDFERVAQHSMHDRYIHTNPRPIAGPHDIVEILKLAA
ncbi:MAG: maleylacetate reductase [Gammaproteobacteria bacterium]|jgi:maleylacetate reductase